MLNIQNELPFIIAVFAIGCCAAKSVEGPRRAMIQIQGADVSGKLMMEQASINSPVKIRGVIYGMEPGLHGVHIHASESLGLQCENVGKQLIRLEKRENERLAGHLGNVKVKLMINYLFESRLIKTKIG